MNNEAQSNGASAAETCVQQLEDLQHELQTAISAVARNSLADFEHSLWRQEMLCAGLKRSIFVLGRYAADKQSLAPLRVANIVLQNLNRSYESLVQQSSRSVALLQDLCSLYKNAPLSAIDGALPSLSCEA
jgi:hypothetical protein